ncbi:unnamed protein product [Adineta steineri]|uniref:G-protein coupled receptors family 1 profile domain-containing protein n=1 Tax=Adineta steineri TaxID=433720 RepID=A0A814S2H9_9BILA|nr:unnamed protein product [Adineta steineri]CAF1156754.1 unnamed protein product [Adineta steineri]CAF1159560.1 unnamed protein product [Adineta steineri]CAF3752427.1 unnamed protein product [Adineta steineri]CAF3815797.1 unnamed protein product [Adineta steineri]
MNRKHRYALHNHTILLLLICNLPVQLIDINFYLIFFYYGFVQPSQPIVCLLWWLADFGFYAGGLVLMAWLAIERHILIFHDRLLLNRRGRFLFHYLPLIIIVTYLLVFYLTVIFILPCENTYLYTALVCGQSPCYVSYGILGLWEFTVHIMIPIVLEGIASIALLLRVQIQKRRLRQSNQWRRQRRMIIQLLLVSSLNMGLNFSSNAIFFAHLFGVSQESVAEVQFYFSFLDYFVVLLFPFICLSQFPNLRNTMKEKLLGVVRRRPHHTDTVAHTNRDIPMNRVA